MKKGLKKLDQATPAKHKVFFQLYGNCQNRLYGFLYAMVHNESDAEDLLQDTASTLWEQFAQYQSGTNFSAWAMTIARNKAINFLKKNARSRPQFSDQLYQDIAALEMRKKEDLSDRSDALRRCVQRLKDVDQNLLLLRYDQDVSMVKIAETFGRSTTGIYHTMARIHNVLYHCV